MFEKFDLRQKQYIFQALKMMIESSSGIGFHNKDQGHPFYNVGAEGEKYPATDADGPKKNQLYKMLSELSGDFKANNETGYVWWYDFSEWRNFCKFAYDAYSRKRGV